MTKFAIYYEPSAYSMDGKVMGRQSAGFGFMRSIANEKLTSLTCHAASRAAAQHCAQVLTNLGSPKTGVSWISYEHSSRLSSVGTLYHPDPNIAPHAWRRLNLTDPRSYSICGITHTISSHAALSTLADYITAPIEEWDALICTSNQARDAVRHVLHKQAEYLSNRIGATKFCMPQLPVIPLGIHTSQFRVTNAERSAARAQFGLADDEVAVLFAGRLIIHGKAHPLPMYLSLEAASKGKKVALIQAGQAPSKEIFNVFAEMPKRFCPSVKSILVDGADAQLYKSSWAAADVFVSLSDNFQETFGLTPIEAMAAGIPVVVSDWNGYKDTVRNGIDGYRVPTLAIPPGVGQRISDRYDWGIDDFDYYSGHAAQYVAINIELAAESLRRLINDDDLRRNMGSEGKLRAERNYDWSIILQRYYGLWEELSERRRGSTGVSGLTNFQKRPDRTTPFSMFSGYPTLHAEKHVRFKRGRDSTYKNIESFFEHPSIRFAAGVLPTIDVLKKVFDATRSEWTELEEIAAAATELKADSVAEAVTWLSKFGLLSFESTIK